MDENQDTRQENETKKLARWVWLLGGLIVAFGCANLFLELWIIFG